MSDKVKVLSNTFLKGVMTDAFVSRGYCPDLNTCFASGSYNTDSKTLNIPHVGLTNASLLVFAVTSNIAIQFLVNSAYLLFRRRQGGTLSNWMSAQVAIFPSSSGGVKHYRSISCDFSQKGGSHEYGRTCFIERVAEGSDGGCYGGKRVTDNHRLECFDERRMLCDSSLSVESSCEHMSIRNIDSVLLKLLRRSDIHFPIERCTRKIIHHRKRSRLSFLDEALYLAFGKEVAA